MMTARLFLLVVTVACVTSHSHAQAPAKDGKVSGTVVIDGAPLAAGRIFYHLANGQFVGAKVKDGKYTVDRVPVGKRAISVEGAGVPAKYSSEDTSGLVLEVKAGSSTHDISLR
jgi:hypothetical protein